MDDPEVQGLSAERTVWSLSLPPGYELDRRMTDLFGNMEEVPSEARVVAETESWLSDLVRLNKSFSLRSSSGSKKRLLEEGDKMVAQLEGKISDLESKLYSKRRYEDGATVGKDAISGEVAKLKQELASQQIVLTENRIAPPVIDHFDKAQLGNTWSSQSAKPSVAQPSISAVGSNGINDNVGVNGGFLSLNGTVKGAELQYNVTGNVSLSNSNARGNNTFVQGWTDQTASQSAPKPISAVPPPPAARAKSMEKLAASPAPAPQKAAPVDVEEFEDFLQPTPQLRATGRRSMQVEMPLTANTFHFRKLKDHAVLEVSLTNPASAEQRRRFWIFLGSLAGVGLIWIVGQRKAKTR
jgi:hypothetical protein